MKRAAACAALWSGGLLFAQQGDRIEADKRAMPADLEVPPAVVRVPAEELATFQVAAGFAVELVASEPLVADPVQAVFDAQGRLWVVEMRGYMRTVDAAGELDPTGRICVLQDRDGDGRMDDSTVFADGLVLPRGVLPLLGGALVIEPPRLWFYPDADHDLVPEARVEVADGFDAGLANPEHSGNSMLWALDNCIHLANDGRRLRWQAAGERPFVVLQGASAGQWGLSQDDRGRLYYNYNEDWLRVDLVPRRYSGRSATPRLLPGHNHRAVTDTSVHPIRVTPGVNRGGRDGMLADGKLVRHTAVCAPHVYRGDLLADCRGDAFVCEPAGNLLRRFQLREVDGAIAGTNRYEQAEFLASTDERFRPVNLTTGPDGALYVVDMYRGVIQHKNFVTTFLRRQIQERGLEQPVGMGRIWRIVPQGGGRAVAVDVQAQDTDGLVRLLEHANGHVRDQSQRLLVQREARHASAKLRALVREDAAPASLHAFAVLDGLGLADAATLRVALQSRDAGMLCLALAGLGAAIDGGDRFLLTLAEELAQHADPAVRRHLALALGDVRKGQADRALGILVRLGARCSEDPMLLSHVRSSLAGREAAACRALTDELATLGDGALVLATSLATQAGQSRNARRQEAVMERAAATLEVAMQRALLEGLLAALPPATAADQGAAGPAVFRLPVTPPSLLAIVRTNRPDCAPLAQRLLLACQIGVAVTAGAAEPTAAEQVRLAAGAKVFSAYCAACHQPDGRGLPGLAPPLLGSEWVAGDPERLIRVVLHGVRGPLKAAGVAFDGEMPAQAHLGDEELAAALSWVRRTMADGADAVPTAEVARLRAEHQGRAAPWSAAELSAK